MNNPHESSRIELPIVTHWSNVKKQFEYLASDIPEITGDATGPFSPGECYYEYNDHFLPDFNVYIAGDYAHTAISDSDASGFVRSAFVDTGIPIDLLRPDAFTIKQKGLGRLINQSGTVQILHAKVIDGSLATIILPPNWSIDADENTYPIVFNGFYDLNANVFSQEGPVWVRMIAKSGIEGRSGAIGVLWNGGGAMGSRTINEAAYRQFHSIIDFISNNFSGDRHRILMSGGSRGGLTSVSMASNPYGYDYTVIFAAATATPTLVGEHIELTSTTYPPLLPSTVWSVGLADAWRTNWTYPSSAEKPHLKGLTANRAHSFILVGTSNLDEANAMHSPMSDRFIQGLKLAGTRIFLTVTEKDNIVPYSTQFKYACKLKEQLVPLQVEILLRGGHTERFVETEIGKVYARNSMLFQHVLALVEKRDFPEFTNDFSYYSANRITGVMEPLERRDNFIPFSVDVPYMTARGMKFPLVFVGHPDTQYSLTIQTAQDHVFAAYSGVIPSSCTTTAWCQVPDDIPLGEYIYTLKIKKPGQKWVDIPDTMTPSGDRAILKVAAEEPNIRSWEAWEWCKAPKLAASDVPREHTNWGLTEY